MLIEEFTELAKYIAKNHGLYGGSRKRIKYVRCSFDTRTSEVFSVSLDGVDFATVNENGKRDLKKWVYCYLKGEGDGYIENIKSIKGSAKC